MIYKSIPIITNVLFEILYYGKMKIGIVQLFSLAYYLILLHTAESDSKYRHISSCHRFKKLITSVVNVLGQFNTYIRCIQCHAYVVHVNKWCELCTQMLSGIPYDPDRIACHLKTTKQQSLCK